VQKSCFFGKSTKLGTKLTDVILFKKRMTPRQNIQNGRRGSHFKKWPPRIVPSLGFLPISLINNALMTHFCIVFI